MLRDLNGIHPETYIQPDVQDSSQELNNLMMHIKITQHCLSCSKWLHHLQSLPSGKESRYCNLKDIQIHVRQDYQVYWKVSSEYFSVYHLLCNL